MYQKLILNPIRFSSNPYLSTGMSHMFFNWFASATSLKRRETTNRAGVPLGFKISLPSHDPSSMTILSCFLLLTPFLQYWENSWYLQQSLKYFSVGLTTVPLKREMISPACLIATCIAPSTWVLSLSYTNTAKLFYYCKHFLLPSYSITNGW